MATAHLPQKTIRHVDRSPAGLRRIGKHALNDLFSKLARDKRVTDGAGNFTAVSTAEGIITTSYTQAHVEDGSAPHHTWCTAACDVDNDGEPDLLTASYGRDFNTFWRGGFKDGGARFDVSNLQSLCVSCHNRKTARESAGRSVVPHGGVNL